MATRPTIADLAHQAGVSVATVDRVLNGRLPVREATARRVYDVAEAIGYHATGLIRRQIERDLPQVSLGFLLQHEEQAFYRGFAAELRSAAGATAGYRVRAEIDFLATQTPAEVAGHLRQAARRCQAIAVVAVDHPTIAAAVAEVRASGVQVHALLSDFAIGERDAYAGLDNRKVGRTAAWLVARTAPRVGTLAVLVGSHRFNGHEAREIGFRSYFRELAPQFDAIETIVNLEEPRIAHEALLDLHRRHPDLAGVYVAGGGMEGAIAAMREEGLAGRVALVCNELTAESRAALAENVVVALVATPVARLARELVAAMSAPLLPGSQAVPGDLLLPFDIHISENI